MEEKTEVRINDDYILLADSYCMWIVKDTSKKHKTTGKTYIEREKVAGYSANLIDLCEDLLERSTRKVTARTAKSYMTNLAAEYQAVQAIVKDMATALNLEYKTQLRGV